MNKEQKLQKKTVPVNNVKRPNSSTRKNPSKVLKQSKQAAPELSDSDHEDQEPLQRKPKRGTSKIDESDMESSIVSERVNWEDLPWKV